jgi:hypothetical protein
MGFSFWSFGVWEATIEEKVANEDYPLFRKVYDVSLWITGRVEQYPKSQRFLLGARTLDLCYELLSSTVDSI